MVAASAAVEEWERAIALAESYRLDRQKAKSQLKLALTLADLGKYDEAHRWLRFATATLGRIGGDSELETEGNVIDGQTYYAESKYADAVRVLERALEHPNVERADPRNAAVAHFMLGLVLSYGDARLPEAVMHARAALSIDEEALGPQHLTVSRAATVLAMVEMEAGRLDDALASATRSVASFRATVNGGQVLEQSAGFGDALAVQGNILLRLGRTREAVDLFEQARRTAGATGQGLWLAAIDIGCAEALRQLGHLDDAERLIAEARPVIAEEDKDGQSVYSFELLFVEAQLALDRGKNSDALPLAERALTIGQSGVAPLYDLSSARFALARALARGKRDAGRAHTLAEQARDGFAKLEDQPRIDEASALLTELR